MINLKRNKGFTIVEIVVVIAIIAILVLIAVPQYTRYIQRAKDTKYTSEGAEIYKVIVQGTQQLSVAGEDPYFENELIPVLNENIRTINTRGNDDIIITNGMDEAFDGDNTQTWGLIIDEERRTITYNNRVDADHNYVFVNGVFIEDFVAPANNADNNNADNNNADNNNTDNNNVDNNNNSNNNGNNVADNNGNVNSDEASSGNSTMDAEAAIIAQAVYNARQSLKNDGKNTNDLFDVNTITSYIQRNQTLKPVFGSNNIKKRLMDGTDTNVSDKYWGLQVVETGVKNDNNLDNDDIIITNLTPDGLFTYRNGKFEKKQ